MSQSIASISNTAIAAYQSGETVQTHGGGTFNLSKNVEVVSSTSSTDTVDLSPDARNALQSFLAGGSTGTASAAGATGSDANSMSDDSIEISVTAATASTTGHQADYATASDYAVSWTAADGQTGEVEVEEGWSLTTNLQLVPLAPQLQEADAPAVTASATASATAVTIGENAEGSSASIATVTTRSSGGPALDGSEAALMMLEAATTNPSRNGPERTDDSSGSTVGLRA